MKEAKNTLKIITFKDGAFNVHNAIDNNGVIDASTISIHELMTSPYVFVRASGVSMERIAAAFTDMPMPKLATGDGDTVYLHGKSFYSVSGFIWHGEWAKAIALNLPNI